MKKRTAWEKLKNEAVKAAIFCAAFFGNGAASSTNVTSTPPSDNDDFSKKELTVNNTPASDINSFDVHEEIVKQLVTSEQDIIGNFNLEGRELSPEELQMIQQCKLSLDVIQTAKKTAKRGLPKKGQQTYCLGAVKNFFFRNGVDIDADRFAYRAVTGLQKNGDFVELDVPVDKFRYMPDAAVMAWEKGTTRYGHVAMKIGEKEYCDYVYNLRKNNRRGSSGQRYGKCHVFVLSQMKLSQDLLKKLVKEGRLKEDIKRRMLARTKIIDMKSKLSMKDLMVKSLQLTDSTLKNKMPQKIAIKPLDSNSKEFQTMKEKRLRER